MRSFTGRICGAPPHVFLAGRCGVVLSVRPYTRGMPYTPEGTIQDFTSSPMHAKLAEMQQDLDRRTGRPETGLYRGPTVTTSKGARPLFENAAHSANRGNYSMMREQRNGSGTQGRAPSQGQFTAAQPSSPFAPTTPGDNFQQDIRVDPAYADVPEHIRAAKQALLSMQSDAGGQVIRGLVPPPPPLPAEFVAPKAYTQPRVPLDNRWWTFIWAIFAFFFALGYFGK